MTLVTPSTTVGSCSWRRSTKSKRLGPSTPRLQDRKAHWKVGIWKMAEIMSIAYCLWGSREMVFVFLCWPTLISSVLQGPTGPSANTARTTPRRTAAGATATCVASSRTPTSSCCAMSVTWPSTCTAWTRRSRPSPTTRTGESGLSRTKTRTGRIFQSVSWTSIVKWCCWSLF